MLVYYIIYDNDHNYGPVQDDCSVKTNSLSLSLSLKLSYLFYSKIIIKEITWRKDTQLHSNSIDEANHARSNAQICSAILSNLFSIEKS